jgi:hypothetical protein
VGALLQARSEHANDFLNNAVAVIDNVIVPKPQDNPTPLPQGGISQIMVPSPVVLPAVGSHDDARLYTRKIDNVGRDWMLPSEAAAELLIPQCTPQKLLGPGRVALQMLRTSDGPRPDGRRPAPHPLVSVIRSNPAVAVRL